MDSVKNILSKCLDIIKFEGWEWRQGLKELVVNNIKSKCYLILKIQHTWNKIVPFNHTCCWLYLMNYSSHLLKPKKIDIYIYICAYC